MSYIINSKFNYICVLFIILVYKSNEGTLGTEYNFGNYQDPEIDKSYNHLLGRNIYFVSDATENSAKSFYITVVYPSLTLEVQLKLYTDSTEILEAFNEGKKLYFGFDLMIENIDIKVANYDNYRTDIIICYFDKNDVECHDYLYDKENEVYLLNDGGVRLNNNLIPLGFSNEKLNFIVKNVIEYNTYFSVKFEKPYPPLFDNITMFSWMNYVGSDTGEGIIGFYGIMEDGMDINSISINKPMYYEQQDFYDGAGLPNNSKYLNFCFSIYIIFIFFILFFDLNIKL